MSFFSSHYPHPAQHVWITTFRVVFRVIVLLSLIINWFKQHIYQIVYSILTNNLKITIIVEFLSKKKRLIKIFSGCSISSKMKRILNPVQTYLSLLCRFLSSFWHFRFLGYCFLFLSFLPKIISSVRLFYILIFLQLIVHFSHLIFYIVLHKILITFLFLAY